MRTCMELKEFATVTQLGKEMAAAGIRAGPKAQLIFFKACFELGDTDAALGELTRLQVRHKRALNFR